MLIRAKAPLRISFAGGGTDVPPFPEQEGGCVLSATINRYAYGSFKTRTDRNIRIESLDFGLSADYNLQEPLIFDGKLDLVKAAILRMVDHGSAGFDLFLHSDAPPGSGLGASSAMMVSLVGLLKEWRSVPMTDYEIADSAYVIERKDLGILGGLQDQYAAAFGGFNFIEFLRDRVVVNPLRVSPDVINELQYNLLLVFTGHVRLSANIIEDQVGRYESGQAESVEALRALKAITVEMKNCLLQRRMDEFAQLLHEEWQAKKKMSPKISNPQLDEIYEVARATGALGGKITGAGGGGYMLLYCRYDRKHLVADRLRDLGCVVENFAFEPNGVQTWRVNGA